MVWAISILLVLFAGSTSTAAPPAGLADTPWPMYQHDPAHTGRSGFKGITSPPVLLWRRRLPGLGGGESGANMSIGADGTVYATIRGDLYAYHPPEGSLLWFKGIGTNSRSTPAIARDRRIYWGVDDAFLVISTTGQIVDGFSPITANQVFGSSPVIAEDGTVYVTHDAMLSFMPDSELKWYDSFSNPTHTAPAIGPDGTIYTVADGMLRAYTTAGALKWEILIYASNRSPSVGGDGTIYSGTNTGEVRAINPDGTEKWAFHTDEYSSFGGSVAMDAAPAIGSDGTIYATNTAVNGTTHLYALRPDGSLKWKYLLPQRNPDTRQGIAEAVMLDREDRIYGCSDNGSCYAWNAEGALLWEYLTEPNLWNRTTPLLLRDGMIWILDAVGTLHALIDPSVPALVATPNPLDVSACTGNHTLTRTVAISGTTQQLAWQAQVQGATGWLSINQTSGTTPAELRVTINTAGLVAGEYSSIIRVTTAGGVVNPINDIQVNLSVSCTNYISYIVTP